jgi:hypothetical protein
MPPSPFNLRFSDSLAGKVAHPEAQYPAMPAAAPFAAVLKKLRLPSKCMVYISSFFCVLLVAFPFDHQFYIQYCQSYATYLLS